MNLKNKYINPFTVVDKRWQLSLLLKLLSLPYYPMILSADDSRYRWPTETQIVHCQSSQSLLVSALKVVDDYHWFGRCYHCQ